MTQTFPTIRLPDWPDFKKAPDDEFWADYLRLARASADVYHNELNLLIRRAEMAPVDLKGPDGMPLLTALLKGWNDIRNNHATRGYQGNEPLARFPNPGEDAWDQTGNFAPWELPAAVLIARGANPFEEGPDGLRPWDIAVQVGACAVVKQMLRHPLCPKTTTGTDWLSLFLKQHPWAEDYWEKRSFHSDPLIWAVNMENPFLVEALATGGKRPEHENILFLLTESKQYRRKIDARLITGLVDAGADPLSENKKGMTPLEVWAIENETNSLIDRAWGEAVSKVTPPERMPRAVAAALFANAKEALVKIPEKPRGAQWGKPPYGAPHGKSWAEWAALGVLARNTSENTTAPAVGLLQGMPLKAKGLSEEERQIIKVVQHAVAVNLDRLCDDTPVSFDYFTQLMQQLKTLDIGMKGLGKIIQKLTFQQSSFYSTTADWMTYFKDDFYTAKPIAFSFTGADFLEKMKTLKPEDSASLMHACVRAYIIISTHKSHNFFNESTETETTKQGLIQLFSILETQGSSRDLLTRKEIQEIHEAANVTSKKEWKSILTMLSQWALSQTLQKTIGVQPERSKPRL